MICMTWKHADAIVVHTSMVDFVADYQDVIDNRGLEVWYESPAAIREALADHLAYEMYAGRDLGVYLAGNVRAIVPLNSDGTTDWDQIPTQHVPEYVWDERTHHWTEIA